MVVEQIAGGKLPELRFSEKISANNYTLLNAKGNTKPNPLFINKQI